MDIHVRNHCGAISINFEANSRKRLCSNNFTAKNRLYLGLAGYLDKLSAYEDNPYEYLKKACLQWTSVIVWPTALLFLLAAASLEREMKAVNIYTAESAIISPYFPWEINEVKNWSDAQSVALGCNYIEDDNESDIIYEVEFADDTSYRLSTATTVRGEWLDNIEIIDQALFEARVEFKRWKWLKRNPLHPQCLNFYRNTYSVHEYERLELLLRVGAF